MLCNVVVKNSFMLLNPLTIYNQSLFFAFLFLMSIKLGTQLIYNFYLCLYKLLIVYNLNAGFVLKYWTYPKCGLVILCMV